MLKSYLFIYSNSVGTREKVKQIIDSMEEISKWRYEIDNSFFVISENSARELSDAFDEALGNANGRHLFTEITKNKQGWLSGKSWHLINEKEYKPKDD